MKRSGLSLISCAIGISVVIGMDWHSEHASGASVTDSSFDWRAPNGASSSFITPIKDQGNTPECSFFARVGVAEAWYKITRNDTTDVWCGAAQSTSPTSQTGLSEQTIVDLDYNSGINGTFPDMVNPNNPSDNTHGLLTRQDLNWHASGSQDPPQPGWTIPAADLNRRFFITSCTTAIPTPGSAQAKAMLVANGPFRIPVYHGYDFLGNFGNYPGPPATSDHSVMVTGWQNLPASDPNYAAWGGGYFVVKNSWGTSSNDGDGYYGGAYGSYAGVGSGFYGVPYAVLDHRADYVSDMVTGPAYFNGALSAATWTNGTGNFLWNTSSANWNHTAGTWGQGEVTNGWLNGETAATFAGTGPATITVDANSHISAYGITVAAGSNYTFAGAPLIITGYHNDPSITNGGINAHASVTFNNSKITVGAPSTWTVDPGQTLSVNSPLDLHISTLTIDGFGTTNLNGVVSDVVTDPAFSGLLSGYSGSLVKNGAGTLNLNNTANTFSGSVTVNAGTVGITDSNALRNNTLVWNAGTLSVAGSAAQTLTLGGLAGTGTLTVPAALTVGGNNANTVFSGVLAGPGCSLTKTGTGTLALSTTNTYGGDTYLDGGLISASSLSNLGTGNRLVFNGGGLHFATSSFDPSQRTMLFSGNATFDVRDGDNVWLWNPIGGGGSGSLTKTGNGRVSLYGANDYSGPTIVAGGALSPRNTAGSATGSGPVTVEPGAMLAGWGIVSGPVSIAGTLAPDSCSWSASLPEILTINNQVSFQPGSTFAVMANGLAAGSGYGQLLTTGPVSLAGSLALTFGNFAPTGHDILFLINNSGSEATLGRFQYADNARIGTFDGLDWYITYDADNGAVPGLNGGNDVAIYDVPEPSGLVLPASGLLSLLAYRWRRRRS